MTDGDEASIGGCFLLLALTSFPLFIGLLMESWTWGVGAVFVEAVLVVVAAVVSES